MLRKSLVLTLAAILVFCVLMPVWAQQPNLRLSNFLEDPPALSPLEDGSGAWYWEKPNIAKRYNAVMFEVPEFFLHPESKYKGIKADEITVLAEAFEEGVSIKLADAYPVVDVPGPQVVRVRMALTDVYMKKKGFKPWNILPVGLVAYAIKSAVGKNVSLEEASIELEALDSETGERLAVLVNPRGQLRNKSQNLDDIDTSWDDIMETFGMIGDMARARMDWLQERQAARP